jgi:hypothetical protein
MTAAALAVATLALVVSILSVAYTRRATHAQEAEDRRARLPKLNITSEYDSDENATSTIYTVRNDGPDDLDSVVVHRPRPPDGITYPIAVVSHDWADDTIELGPLALTQETKFILCTGRGWPHAFRVRIDCQRDRDKWTLTEELEQPQRGAGVY